MKAPQIIWLVLVGIELLFEAHKHGNMKTDRHNIFVKLFNVVFTLAILYWGGFF